MNFFTADWIATLRARTTNPGFAEACRTLETQVAKYRAFLPGLPEQQAGYYHNFFCPHHAVQLIFDPRSPHQHQCPVDRATFSGEPFDSAWLWSVNDVLSDAAFKFALRGFSFANQTDLTRAQEILTSYAERYRDLPRAPGAQPKYPGHALWSSLDESIWIIRLIWAYAFLKDAWSIAEQAKIRDGLLRPAADQILRTRRTDIHNITNWHNAALTTLAIALNDAPLLRQALDGSAGVRAQLTQGVRADGMWWEGSLSYHYYTLSALIWTMRVLRASGHAFDANDTIRKMFAAPLALAFPDLSLPAMNDCWYAIGLTGAVGHGIPPAAGFYEIAYGWYRDPAFAWILGENYAHHPRASIEALLDGAEIIPTVPAPAFASAHLPESGIVVLRARAKQTCLILKASPRGSTHDHPDQLSIQLFAHGARLSSDLGTPGYGIGLTNTWYRETISHNTVLLDGHSQPLGSTRDVKFRIEDQTAFVQASVVWDESVYAGVRMTRIIFWREAYFIDAFLVDCPEPHQIDWVYHNAGELFECPAGAGELADAYQHIVNATRIAPAENVRVNWRIDRARLDLFFAPRANEKIIVGRAPGNPASENLSIMIRRQNGASAKFISVFCPWPANEEPFVRRALWNQTDPLSQEIIVETINGFDKWIMPAENSTEGEECLI